MFDFASGFETITPEMWIAHEEEYLEKLAKLSSWSQIPLLNCNASHNLPDNTLVRFKGMVQDMHNPEFYFESFEIYNTKTEEVTKKSGKYRDTANILENEKVNYSSNLKSGERLPLVVVSIPGLNQWAVDLEEKENKLPHLGNQPNSSKRLSLDSSSKLKRTFDETEVEDPDAMEVQEPTSLHAKGHKTQESTAGAVPTVSREHLLNFPLPEVASQSCLVKVYRDEDKVKINDIVEVVGFLSVDPSLSGEFAPEKNALMEDGETDVETLTLHPPPSLVPRLHAVCLKKLSHCNPLVSQDVSTDAYEDRDAAREHLSKALTELLLGDKLAADYLICHLISHVYMRQVELSLGQLALNISGVPAPAQLPQYARRLYAVLRQFVPASHYLPMTLHNMNCMALVPKKDYACSRLTSGVLQLGAGTHLVLDETALEQGRLDSTGVANLAALGALVRTQRVEYDFHYYKLGFDTDIPVLVLSEGKSLLPSDIHIPLQPEESSIALFKEIVEAATYYLKDDVMNAIRTYLTSLKFVKFTMSDDATKFVEDDFIEMRNSSTADQPVTADDLHRLLVLARLVSLARGHNTLTKPCWEEARRMEAERMLRVRNRIS